ncbi:MAG: GNAT family N-acetyltransferase [Alkalimonas sp.]|nr:GNAT family N-acetyltransferase [Alkalimonas sp.]
MQTFTSSAALRPLQQQDFPVISAWLHDRENMQKVCGNVFDYPLTEAVFTDYFVLGPQETAERQCFAYEGNGQLLGMCSFTRIDWPNSFGHIGLVAVDPALRGQGIGQQMFAALLHKGFVEHGFHRIDLYVMQGNEGAKRFYQQRFGFQDEGLMREVLKTEQGYTGWYTLSLLVTEWSGSK